MALWWPNKLRRENKKDRQFAIAVHFQTRSKVQQGYTNPWEEDDKVC